MHLGPFTAVNTWVLFLKISGTSCSFHCILLSFSFPALLIPLFPGFYPPSDASSVTSTLSASCPVCLLFTHLFFFILFLMSFSSILLYYFCFFCHLLSVLTTTTTFFLFPYFLPPFPYLYLFTWLLTYFLYYLPYFSLIFMWFVMSFLFTFLPSISVFFPSLLQPCVVYFLNFHFLSFPLSSFDCLFP